MGSRSGRQRNLREQLAQEAARIMVQGGIRDFQFAKRKAAAKLGVRWQGRLPSNEEVDAALGEYQRLFRFDSQPQRLKQMRQTAVHVMRLTEMFAPRLVGSVLAGTADGNSKVTLHTRCDPVERFAEFLLARNIPHHLSDRRMRVGPDQYRRFPTYEFVLDDVPIEILVFDRPSFKNIPLSPIDGRPMARARIDQVEALAQDG